MLLPLCCSLSLAGMYRLLRLFKLSHWSAVFGAIGFAWTPHFVTLMYPTHVDSFCLIGYIPWFFYLMSVAMDGQENNWKSWGSAIALGAVWGDDF